jgi:hypothetical protein
MDGTLSEEIIVLCVAVVSHVQTRVPVIARETMAERSGHTTILRWVQRLRAGI